MRIRKGRCFFKRFKFALNNIGCLFEKVYHVRYLKKNHGKLHNTAEILKMLHVNITNNYNYNSGLTERVHCSSYLLNG